MRDNQLSFPVVVKPDVGERGTNVSIVRTEEELCDAIGRSSVDLIVQEYVAGLEFGLFYSRLPDEEQGHLTSITEKQFPVVKGDGVSTLEQLILADPRAVAMAPAYLQRNSNAAERIPAAGELVQLVEIGSHCKGAVFLNGARLWTAKLEAEVERVSRCFPGFHLGRFDVRSPSIEALQGGEFRVLELNGVSSEPTHIYDPTVSLFATYRALFRQWRTAFAIGAAIRKRGLRPASVRQLLQLLLSRVLPA
jgi:hypothetical protein